MTAYKIDVRIEAPVQYTEVTERVTEAIETLFPEADVDSGTDVDPGPDGDSDIDHVTAVTHDLGHFRERLFEQRILDTARGVFFDRRGPNGFSFELKKQAARQDVVNFAVGNPDELGDIQVAVTVREPKVEEFIDYLAPATEDGEPPSMDGAL